MSRITNAFEKLKADGRKGFIPFITAGDPDLWTTRDLLIELARSGATVIELGVPFSDPMADGPVIQRASERALKHRFGIDAILEVVSDVRDEMNGVPVVLFSYLNPIFQFGIDRLAASALQVGIDGLLITDLVPEESGTIVPAVRGSGLDMVFLVAPTSSDDRLKHIASVSSGFVYAVSRAGITGARTEVSSAAETLAKRVKRYTDLPVAVGFGISTPEQVRDTWRYADAAVVGSAIVSQIEQLGQSKDLVSTVGRFCQSLISDPDALTG